MVSSIHHSQRDDRAQPVCPPRPPGKAWPRRRAGHAATGSDASGPWPPVEWGWSSPAMPMWKNGGRPVPGSSGCMKRPWAAGIARLARAVHAKGGRFVVQLAHGGCRSNSQLSGEPTVGPSVPGDPKAPPCREMTHPRIWPGSRRPLALRRPWPGLSRGGRRADSCRPRLWPQPISVSAHQPPFGSLRRFPGEHGRGCCSKWLRPSGAGWARNYPVLAKLNSEDFLDGGLTPGRSVQVAHWLEGAGLDALELSGAHL